MPRRSCAKARRVAEALTRAPCPSGAFRSFTLIFGSLVDTLGSGTTMSESLRPVILWFCYLGGGLYRAARCLPIPHAHAAPRASPPRSRGVRGRLPRDCVLGDGRHPPGQPHQARPTVAPPRRTPRPRRVLTAARRRQYLTALLRQEMAFFDTHDTGALLARVVTDTNAIQLALSSKCPNLIHHGMAGVIGIIIGLVRGWQMALVVCATLPLMGAPRLRLLRPGPPAHAATRRRRRRCHGHVAAALDQDRIGRLRRRLSLCQGGHLCVPRAM